MLICIEIERDISSQRNNIMIKLHVSIYSSKSFLFKIKFYFTYQPQFPLPTFLPTPTSHPHPLPNRIHSFRMHLCILRDNPWFISPYFILENVVWVYVKWHTAMIMTHPDLQSMKILLRRRECKKSLSEKLTINFSLFFVQN